MNPVARRAGHVGHRRPAVGSVNLYVDGGFEANLAVGAVRNGGPSLVRTFGAGRSGYGMVASFTGTNTGAAYDFFASHVATGKAHSAAVWVKPSKTVTFGPSMQYLDSGANYVSGIYAPLVSCPAGVWTRMMLSDGTAPPTATWVSIGIYNDAQSWSAGDSIAFDDVVIVEGSTLP